MVFYQSPLSSNISREIQMGRLPYAGIRIIELSHTVGGRLAGLLFADQGTDVFVAA